jgi:hypothetical protein
VLPAFVEEKVKIYSAVHDLLAAALRHDGASLGEALGTVFLAVAAATIDALRPEKDAEAVRHFAAAIEHFRSLERQAQQRVLLKDGGVAGNA